MSSINITQLQTIDGANNNVKLFSPFTTTIKLVVDFNLSADFLTMQNVKLRVMFEIIEFSTNNVVVYHSHDFNYSSNLGQSLFAWEGDPTPHQLGLQWVGPGRGNVFGFRAAVEASSLQGQNGQIAIDALAVSDVRWFRLKDEYSL